MRMCSLTKLYSDLFCNIRSLEYFITTLFNKLTYFFTVVFQLNSRFAVCVNEEDTVNTLRLAFHTKSHDFR